MLNANLPASAEIKLNSRTNLGKAIRRAALGLLAPFIFMGLVACASGGSATATPKSPDCLTFQIKKVPQTLMGGAAIILQNTYGHLDYTLTVPQLPEGSYNYSLESGAGYFDSYHTSTGDKPPLVLTFTPDFFQPPGSIKICKAGAPEPLQTF